MNTKTRQEKIVFLNGLMKGKRLLSELKPAQFYFIVWDKDTQKYYINETDITMTEIQFNEFKSENPNSEFFIVKTTTEMRLAMKGL